MVLVSTSYFDEVILAEIIISGSQVMTKFDQIFLSYFNRFDFFVFTFFALWFGFKKIINRWRQVFYDE